ncbi:MAG: DUF3990 domain-containing protein [Oscillospiraceae bacterium]|nr:DUF3990 domain-containing protein [Oscillospiraceae bacterium]
MKRKIDEIKTLYHGTGIYHEQIDLNRSAPLKDFGRGYYVTSYWLQASNWARRKGEASWIFQYELAPVPNEMKIRELLQYDEEWLDFIVSHRLRGKDTDFDIVYDRMADNRFDKLSQAIHDYSVGRIAAQRALHVIRFNRDNRDQYCFKTPQAVALLKRSHTYRLRNGRWSEWNETEGNFYDP